MFRKELDIKSFIAVVKYTYLNLGFNLILHASLSAHRAGHFDVSNSNLLMISRNFLWSFLSFNSFFVFEIIMARFGCLKTAQT